MNRLASFVAALFVFAGAARAHDARPLSVVATERDNGQVELAWRTPGSVEIENAPDVALGGACRLIGGQGAQDKRLEGRALYACQPGLSGATFEIKYRLYNPSIATLIRVVRASGETSTKLLGPEAESWAAPPPSTFASVAGNYFMLGVKHILIGIDHILFLFGLVLLAKTPWRVLGTITGFTLSHSLTLALVALGLLRVSVPAIEAAIALSIVFVAAELARGDKSTLASRHPILIASTFGLLHGAGFAAVLREIGLPQTETIPALLFFNVGVEAGQLLLISGYALLVLAWRAARLTIRPLNSLPAPPLAPERLAGIGLGLISAYWFYGRAAAIFA